MGFASGGSKPDNMSNKTKRHDKAELAMRQADKIKHLIRKRNELMRKRREPLLSINTKEGKAYTTRSDLALIRQGKSPRGVGERVVRVNGDRSRSKYNPVIEDQKKGYRQ